MNIFAYGSLVNPKSRSQTLSKRSSCLCEDAVLKNYSRKLNAPYENDGFLYMNIVPKVGRNINGVVIKVSKEDLPSLIEREKGYELTNVTKSLSEKYDEDVFAFTQPDTQYPEMNVLQSYINTCLASVAQDKQAMWLSETIIDNEIFNDTKDPIYEFSDPNGIINKTDSNQI